MPITRIELIENGTVFEIGVASKLVKNAKGKSQKVKHLAVFAAGGVPTLTVIGEDGTTAKVFGAACVYTETDP